MDRLILAEKITWTEAETLLSIDDVLEFGTSYDAWVAATSEEVR